eukprot:gene30112-35089_t
MSSPSFALLKSPALFRRCHLSLEVPAPCPKKPSLKKPFPRFLVCASEDALDRPPIKRCSKEDATKILGVRRNANFDAIISAKKNLLRRYRSDAERMDEIEAAYDALFMGAMQKRLAGSVSQSARYADVPYLLPKTSRSKLAVAQEARLQAPSETDPQTHAHVYGALMLWAFVQVVFESHAAQLSDTASFQTAVACLYAVYTFKRSKGMPLAKAVRITLALLVVGIMLGSGVGCWLSVDLLPIGAFGSPGVLTSEVAILAVSLGVLFI